MHCDYISITCEVELSGYMSKLLFVRPTPFTFIYIRVARSPKTTDPSTTTYPLTVSRLPRRYTLASARRVYDFGGGDDARAAAARRDLRRRDDVV